MDEILKSPIQDLNINTIALYNTLVNKAVASRLNTKNTIF